MPAIEQLGMQAAQQAEQSVMGILLGKINDQRQLNQQKKLQALQMEGQKHMTDYNTAKQLELWQNTSYPAQMEQMKEAGLNPALMYGMGGGGGQTAQIAQGNVQGGEAPKGGGEAIQMQQLGIQYSLLQAQIENIKADTESKKVNTAKTGGVDTEEAWARINKLMAETKNVQAQEAMTKIQTYIQEMTASTQIGTADANLAKIGQEVRLLENQADIAEATKEEAINTIRAKSLEACLKNELLGIEKRLTEQQIQKLASDMNVNRAQIMSMMKGIEVDNMSISKMANELNQNWARIAQDWQRLSYESRKTLVAESMAKSQATTAEAHKSIAETLRIKLYAETADKVIDKVLKFIPGKGRNPIGFK